MLSEQLCDIESQWEKVSWRSIVGRGHIGHNLGSYEGFAWYVPNHIRPFLFGCHILFCCFFCTWSDERSWFLDTFENVCRNIWPTSTNIREWNCEWWNGVISGIDAHGNWIWPMWLGNTVWAILSYAAVMCQIHKKLVKGELWA